jgi:Integrase core domain
VEPEAFAAWFGDSPAAGRLAACVYQGGCGDRRPSGRTADLVADVRSAPAAGPLTLGMEEFARLASCSPHLRRDCSTSAISRYPRSRSPASCSRPTRAPGSTPPRLFRHVRTRVRSPQTNGVVERFFGTLKYEHLYRATIGDGNALAVEVNLFRHTYNTLRPHQALDERTPRAAYLAVEHRD